MKEYFENQQQELDKIGQEIGDAENSARENNIKVLETVKGLVSSIMFKEIESVIVDSDNTYDYKITNKHKGEFQQEDEYPALGGIYVDQTTNGGYIGDDFAGTVSVKIGNNKFFEFCYWM